MLKLLSAVTLVGLGLFSVGLGCPRVEPVPDEGKKYCSHHKGVCGGTDGVAKFCDGTISPSCGC